MRHLVVILLVIGFTTAQRRCRRPPFVPEGICLLFNDCPLLRLKIGEIPVTQLVKDYGGCGHSNGDLTFCCPLAPVDSTSPPLVTPPPTVQTTPFPPSTTKRTTPSSTSRRPPTTSSVPPESFTRAPLRNCPSGYSSIGGQCLYISKLGTNHNNWEESQSQCSQKGGVLATLRDPNGASRHLKANALGGPSAWYWVGANDSETPGTFRWTSGEPVEGPWRSIKPWGVYPGRMCVYFTDEGFGTTPCSDKTWFICQASDT